jgi:transposase
MVEAAQAQAAAFKNVGALTGRPPMDFALLLDALFYWLRNAGPLRDLPAEFGPWRTVYGCFRLWADNGLWARMLKSVANAGGVVCLVDGTHIPVHQSGCNPRGGADRQAMGRTRGGATPRLWH